MRQVEIPRSLMIALTHHTTPKATGKHTSREGTRRAKTSVRATRTRKPKDARRESAAAAVATDRDSALMYKKPTATAKRDASTHGRTSGSRARSSVPSLESCLRVLIVSSGNVNVLLAARVIPAPSPVVMLFRGVRCTACPSPSPSVAEVPCGADATSPA